MPKTNTSLEPWSYGAVVLLVSAAYYALYLNSGFSPADDGNYAQAAYELFLGRAPDELVLAYGILWFKAGEVLFHLFGVNYVLVKILFFTTITLTNVLIFYTITLASGSRLFALAMTAAPLAVPAFPATAFYGLCIMLNAAAQMRLANRLSTASLWDAAIAGTALSLSFQIRPDFGYVWAIPLVMIIALAAYDARQIYKAVRLLVAAAAAFTLAQVPLLMSASAEGYVGLIVQQYLSYPAMMYDYAISGLQTLFSDTALQTGGISDSVGGTSLQRPGLAEIFSDDRNISNLAILIYAPIAGLAGFVAVNSAIFAGHWKEKRLGTIAQVGVLFFTAIAALPHYFFYRPDLSHIANFMPGYSVMAAAFLWLLYSMSRTAAAPWQRWAARAGLSATALHLGFYVWVGMQTPGTGSMASAAEHTEPFQARNGVDVNVSPAEKDQYEGVRNIIEQNSKPGDSIVCVPYCPGFAFMTDRRMLFKNFYVDDSTPIRVPGWISDAITRTREVRPPVVIIMDWAINGTEASRFENWAAAYVEALQSLSREKIVRPGLTIYLL
jgi:hypothetical protein